MRETPYPEEDVKKYIAFAKCFKPKVYFPCKSAPCEVVTFQVNAEAADTLVATYKRLRLQDSNNAATSSWRITVRQLESLVRLSEALARLKCSAEVSVHTAHSNYGCQLALYIV